MGTGIGEGDDRAVMAARAAISSPLLEDASVNGARGVIINVTGGPDISLIEVSEASSIIQEAAHEEANIIFGAVVDPKMAGKVKITVIATGFDRPLAAAARLVDADAGGPDQLRRAQTAAVGPARPRPARHDRAPSVDRTAARQQLRSPAADAGDFSLREATTGRRTVGVVAAGCPGVPAAAVRGRPLRRRRTGPSGRHGAPPFRCGPR